MQVEVNGTWLWFDVDGAALVADGPRMRERPTVVLVHGGPGSYDHSSREIVEALPRGTGQLAVIEGAGHFPWLDAPDRYWQVIEDFVRKA